MKNEIKIIIVLSFIVILLVGYIIFRELDTRSKNRAYQDNIAELETTTTELRNTNTELGKQIEIIGNNLASVESNYTELEERNTEALESLRRLEDVSSQLRKENKGFGEDITELEELLTEFFID